MSLSRKQVTDTVSLPEKLRVEKGKRLSREELHVIITAHHAALRSGERVLKDGHRNAVTSVRHGSGWFCVKEYRSHGLADRIKDRLRGSRARRAWSGTSHLRKHGIAAPEAVSQVEQDGVLHARDPNGTQWRNQRMPEWIMTMPYSSAA